MKNMINTVNTIYELNKKGFRILPLIKEAESVYSRTWNEIEYTRMITEEDFYSTSIKDLFQIDIEEILSWKGEDIVQVAVDFSVPVILVKYIWKKWG